MPPRMLNHLAEPKLGGDDETRTRDLCRDSTDGTISHGVDGLIVSNHGGRDEESLRPTIESLPEVIEGVAGKIPVIVDGGIRRGTDIFKAVAMGATAVGIGRPVKG